MGDYQRVSICCQLPNLNSLSLYLTNGPGEEGAEAKLFDIPTPLISRKQTLKKHEFMGRNNKPPWVDFSHWIGGGLEDLELQNMDSRLSLTSSSEFTFMLIKYTVTLKSLSLTRISNGEDDVIQRFNGGLSRSFPQLVDLYLSFCSPVILGLFSSITAPKFQRLDLRSNGTALEAFDCLKSLFIRCSSSLVELEYDQFHNSVLPVPSSNFYYTLPKIRSLKLGDAAVVSWFSRFKYPSLDTLATNGHETFREEFRKNAPNLV